MSVPSIFFLYTEARTFRALISCSSNVAQWVLRFTIKNENNIKVPKESVSHFNAPAYCLRTIGKNNRLLYLALILSGFLKETSH